MNNKKTSQKVCQLAKKSNHSPYLLKDSYYFNTSDEITSIMFFKFMELISKSQKAKKLYSNYGSLWKKEQEKGNFFRKIIDMKSKEKADPVKKIKTYRQFNSKLLLSSLRINKKSIRWAFLTCGLDPSCMTNIIKRNEIKEEYANKTHKMCEALGIRYEDLIGSQYQRRYKKTIKKNKKVSIS